EQGAALGVARERRPRDRLGRAREGRRVVGRGVAGGGLAGGPELERVEAERAREGEEARGLVAAGRAAPRVVVGVGGQARVVNRQREGVDAEHGERVGDCGARAAHPGSSARPAKYTTASGGSVTTIDCGCPCAATGWLSTPPRLPMPLPP